MALKPSQSPTGLLWKLANVGLVQGIARRMLADWGQAMAEEDMTFGNSAEEQALQQAVDLVAAYIRQRPANKPRPLAVEVVLEAPWSIRSPGTAGDPLQASVHRRQSLSGRHGRRPGSSVDAPMLGALVADVVRDCHAELGGVISETTLSP